MDGDQKKRLLFHIHMLSIQPLCFIIPLYKVVQGHLVRPRNNFPLRGTTYLKTFLFSIEHKCQFFKFIVFPRSSQLFGCLPAF